ncbi:TnsA-like heteromeric transposase endonuclease subunit [Streptomyces sp. NPDC059994]|uniref:TnsA-like heteromeric transposase endonuclease subunit n=1 Tax=Streptomyces sp. NPDC059994 TaxID=3347029 RepID=UPI00369C81D4
MRVASGTAPRDAAGLRSPGEGPGGTALRLFWPGRRGGRGHVSDFFVRLGDGGGLVVDVHPDGQIGPDDAEAFAATARACELAGWSFRRVGLIDPVLLANVKWLAGYRHPSNQQNQVARELEEAFAQPMPLLAGAERVGDRLAVLPVLGYSTVSEPLGALSSPVHGLGATPDSRPTSDRRG